MTMQSRERTLTEAIDAIQRAVVPLGGYSPYNDGFTEARKRALGAVSDLTEIEPRTDPAKVYSASLWALVQFQVKVMERDAEDKRVASEANGWRMSSTHDLAQDVIDTISRLATGSLDAEAYLAEQDRLQREGDAEPEGIDLGNGLRAVSHPDLAAAFHERTGRCLGGNHVDCVAVEAKHRAHDHSDCIPTDGEEPKDYVAMIQEQSERLHQAAMLIPPNVGKPTSSLTCPSIRPFDEPDQCSQPFGHRGPHRAGLGTEVWRDGQTRSIHDRSERPDGRRADWDALNADQKMAARLDGSEYVPLTLEQRVERLEARVAYLSAQPSAFDVIGYGDTGR